MKHLENILKKKIFFAFIGYLLGNSVEKNIYIYIYKICSPLIIFREKRSEKKVKTIVFIDMYIQ